ncbi:MAG: putative toxin-antitoxin system toxin component, PIN family [Terracidiphilus sp.]|jgi:putative PIN family toxin of toxin-antitoxin system
MARRVVIDTNAYVSRFIHPNAIPGQAVTKALDQDLTLISILLWEELRSVLHRPKFARYIKPDLLEPFLASVLLAAEPVEIKTRIRACRDPKDDMFLELAVDGRADAIVTGDRDLLALHPFRGIAILAPADYLKLK